MNQILATSVGNKKSGGPLEIKTILIIFSICIIVFGGFLIGKAVFNIINKNQEQGISEPLVEITQSDNILNINVKHDKIIDKIIYSWNAQQEIVLQGKGRMELQEKIDIPIGTNIISLKVIDITGKTASYNEQYTVQEGDKIKPEIELQVENSKVKISVKDETELDYISYYWNNEDETKITAREESSKQIEEKIDILKGENTLTIVAVDKAGNKQTKEQTFKGAKKPKIELSRVGNDIVIKVTDEEEIKKIEYTFNGQVYSTDPNNTGASLGMKELEIKQPMVQGENKITVKAYNISDLETELPGEATL